MTTDWISAETERKEDDFRGILAMHANICKGILSRRSAQPYLYVDLYAGRGHLEFNGRRFDGSPLIARDTLSAVGIPYEAVHYERDSLEAAHLIEALSGRSSTLFDDGRAQDFPVYIESCQDGFASKATFNETTGDGISWASWSWNPVTGCLHGCDYCYARAIAARFPDGFPAGFTPLFHHERLDAPANTVIPARGQDDPAYRRVFVCSMADLYGRWVPDEWIEQVHASMLASPQWEYLLLTKFPARYVGLDLPPNAWVGTSVDEQKRVRIAEDAFRKIDGVRVKWLSLEPLKEPLEFTDLSMFDWVVIGAQTATRQPDGPVDAFAPPFEWVARIVTQALDAGCRVHMKPNLFGNPGMVPLDQYPGA